MKKSLAWICTVGLLFSLLSVGNPMNFGAVADEPSAVDSAASTIAVTDKTFSPATASNDGLTDNNPERGWRTHLYFEVGDAVRAGNDYRSVFEDVYNYFFGKITDDHVSTAFTYIYLSDWYDVPVLPPEALDIVDKFCAFAREKKFSMLLSFCYASDPAGDLSGCATQDIMLAHISQLAPLVKKNKDVIHCIKNGFVGSYGEWAYQKPEVDKGAVMTAIVNEFCKPTGLAFLSRLPRYKNLVSGDPSVYDRVGFANDAIYGEQTYKDWCSDELQKGTPAWEQISEEGAYYPNDGEMCTNYAMTHYHNSESGGTGIVPYGFDVIKETGHHWFSTMSIWHGNYEYRPDDDFVRIMDTWKQQSVTPAMLNEARVVYDPLWFCDRDGNTVSRNCFEFLRDHLGYRISLQSVSMAEDGAVSLKLKNYGFAAPFRMKSGLVILDENGKVVSETQAGDPEKWYSHNPKNWSDTAILEHTVNAQLDLPTESGTYRLAFYMENELGVPANTANVIERDGKYHILHTFRV